jgi:hypothetical protein
MATLNLERKWALEGIDRARRELDAAKRKCEILYSGELEDWVEKFPGTYPIVGDDYVALVERFYDLGDQFDLYMDTVSYDGRTMTGWIEQQVGTVNELPLVYKVQIERELTEDERVLLANLGKLTTETVTEVRLTCG